MKRVLQILVMIMLISFLPASSYDFEVDGMYYTITSMSNLEVEVSSNGKFRDVYINGFWSWENTTPYSGHISIPSSVNYNNRTFEVTGIGKAAFGYPEQYYSGQIDYSHASRNGIPTAITSISLPSTIKYIDDMAFQGCNIQSIELPTSLTVIGIAAFAYTSLHTVMIPNSVSYIGLYAFYASSIESLIIGTSLNTIAGQAFSNCSALLEVFCTSKKCPQGLSVNTFSGAHPALEIYVPTSVGYGFGHNYITFPTYSFNYTGQSHNIEWTNNLKAYQCKISESECQTDVNAGQYTKTLKATYSNGVDLSVEIPYEYTINKAPMTLSVNDVQREYGEPNPPFTCSISGFVNGENEQTLGTTPAFECEATQMSKVGNYRIRASLNAQNYEITYKYGTLNIVKAPITATVSDSYKVYGNINPNFALSFSGLKNNETVPEWTAAPKFSTTATVASGVGKYPVIASDGIAVNYDVTKYNPGTITVNKRDLTAKANNCERLYGEENPQFVISYLGFVNGDTENTLIKKPVAECNATKASNVGTYSIVVTGGEAENYSFVYQDGSLKINPLTVGFKNVYNTVTYMDMDISNYDNYFNYIPEITGPFSEDDFWIELLFLDKDNFYPDSQHVLTISGGEYAGNYVNTNIDRPMYAGKYIFKLTPKRENLNVVANPSQAYLTVNKTSNNLDWDADSPISVKVGEKVDLGITYRADQWCDFVTDYDNELIELSSYDENGMTPHWYATGLKEGETYMSFRITCDKNDMGFYNFSDSQTESKWIKVEPSSGIEGVETDNGNISVRTKNGTIFIYNKPENSIVRVFNLQGSMIKETEDAEVKNLAKGMYVITVEDISFKVML